MKNRGSRKFHRWKFLIALFLHVFFQEANAFEEKICGSVDIRSEPRNVNLFVQDSHLLTTFGECTKMEGSLLIGTVLNESFVESDFIRFPNLIEITGHVLVFSVRALTSLSYILPKLRIIGGQTLIYNYALVIYQNADLKDINLPSLRVIRNGGVRIADNPSLCYVKHINWRAFLHGPIDDVIVQDGSVSGRRCEDECDVPATVSCHTTGRFTSCWNATTCQPRCEFDRVGVNSTLAGPGCVEDDNSLKCHDECLGGCTAPDDVSACFACRTLREAGVCVSQCSPNLYSYKGRCITAEICHSIKKSGVKPGTFLRYKAINGMCDYYCPRGFEEDPDTRLCVKCKGECPRLCYGNYTIESIGQAMELRHCDVVEGFLSIELRSATDRMIAEKLNEAFGTIQEIQGYLMIRFSPILVSLHMFKNLRKIGGKILIQNRFSLVIFENHSLRQLFNPSNHFVITNGSVQIHSNHMLCYRKIVEFMTDIGKLDELREEFQSKISNGDKAICDEYTLEVFTAHSTSIGFNIEWNAFVSEDIDQRKFLGYQVFYKKVPAVDPEMTIDDDRSTCSDTWKMLFVEEESDSLSRRRFAYVDQEVESNSIYAYYVQTRMVNHEGAKSAVSKVHFATTSFGKTSPPRIRSASALDNSSVGVQWDPPLHPNGNITFYRVRWTANRRDTTYAVKHVCDSRRVQYEDDVHMDSGEDDVSPAPMMKSFISSFSPSEEACSTIKGCCVCTYNKSSNGVLRRGDGETRVRVASEFENAVQDVVFVPSCDGSDDVLLCEQQKKEAEEKKRKEEEERNGQRGTGQTNNAKQETDTRRRRDIGQGNGKNWNRRTRREGTDPTPAPIIFETDHEEGYLLSIALSNQTDGSADTNDLKMIIRGLRHFTEYQIAVSACQDPNVNGSSCSKDAYYNVRTLPIRTYDMVIPSTITFVQPPNRTSDAFIRFEAPPSPNGQILGFRVTLINQMQEACTRADTFNGGVHFQGIADGSYLVEVRTISEAGESDPSFSEYPLDINRPGLFTLRRLIIGGIVLLLLFVVASLLIWFFLKRYYGKRVGEYVRQVISANPEYCQHDSYTADDWELNRNQLTLKEEIGRGFFGMVYRGVGDNVTSKCGVRFRECAIKTASEDGDPERRNTFLKEASVMKKFNTAFIVKLYGVVSDGQPVLVVMELMEKGNLRDYLRSRRPGAEENTQNLPVPTSEQLFEWAAQISDGMAYLEALKCCHRDLAARNCMVGADDTVKIGDFGLARDIYYHEYYKPDGKRLMPVRWMAPESFNDGKFTMKSDVWSFGIVLYEMLTLAQQPYMGIPNDQVYTFIAIHRKIIEKPIDCPDFWYDLMVACWRYQPRDRPTFREIVDVLAKYASDTFQDQSWVLNEGAILEDDEENAADNGEEENVCVVNRKGSTLPGTHGEGDAIADYDATLSTSPGPVP